MPPAAGLPARPTSPRRGPGSAPRCSGSWSARASPRGLRVSVGVSAARPLRRKALRRRGLVWFWERDSNPAPRSRAVARRHLARAGRRPATSGDAVTGESLTPTGSLAIARTSAHAMRLAAARSASVAQRASSRSATAARRARSAGVTRGVWQIPADRGGWQLPEGKPPRPHPQRRRESRRRLERRKPRPVLELRHRWSRDPGRPAEPPQRKTRRRPRLSQPLREPRYRRHRVKPLPVRTDYVRRARVVITASYRET